ncbi:MAG: hypothetical protein IPG89_08310 [Bacteroidetes bacterium]|nr:hypothetical protein [Bacteroidota bacterium]
MPTDKEDEVVINLIGTGYDINIGAFPSKIKAKLGDEKMNFNLLFDLDFYRKNQFKKNDLGKLIYSWKDINSKNNYIGANLCERSQLEIWINGKRKKTLKLIDFFNDALLFPLYNISESLIDSSINGEQLIIGHQLKGLIAKYTFKTKKFNLDSLQFSILSFQHIESNYKILFKLIYKDSVLKVNLSDTVVTGIIVKLI